MLVTLLEVVPLVAVFLSLCYVSYWGPQHVVFRLWHARKLRRALRRLPVREPSRTLERD